MPGSPVARNAVGAAYDVSLIALTPQQTLAEQDASYGPPLYDRDPDLYCRFRKVAPLNRALARYAWAPGLRRVGSPTRASSIGCSPCTRAVIVGESPRTGRWAGVAKTESGVHR
jgi:phosphoadenosine phosphosulfate reductase